MKLSCLRHATDKAIREAELQAAFALRGAERLREMSVKGSSEWLKSLVTLQQREQALRVWQQCTKEKACSLYQLCIWFSYVRDPTARSGWTAYV
jgi:hypothetical protein